MHRLREPELMDDPSLDEHLHLEALGGLERLNFWSWSAKVLWHPIRALAGQDETKPLRILDIATGGGDVPTRLWHLGRESSLNLHIDGCDVSPRAVEYAQKHADKAGAHVGFFQLDALEDDLPTDYDVMVSSLFFHHLADDQVVALLAKMSRAANRAVLVNDLERSNLNLGLVFIASRALSRSPVVHHDGVASVRAAFTINEIGVLAAKAGLQKCTIERRFPCRFLLKWTRQP